jgi:hypothetical protein
MQQTSGTQLHKSTELQRYIYAVQYKMARQLQMKLLHTKQSYQFRRTARGLVYWHTRLHTTMAHMISAKQNIHVTTKRTQLGLYHPHEQL